MKWQGVVLTIVTLLVLVAGIALFVIPAKAPTVSSGEQPATTTALQVANIPDTIIVSAPTIGTRVSSPLTVSGEARGPWYFEASFPAKLLDASGNVIAQTPGKATGDWMTTDFVPFTINLTFPPQPSGSKGALVLQNDNPSGDPAKQQTLSIPVVFK